jgi:hypothetical protein
MRRPALAPPLRFSADLYFYYASVPLQNEAARPTNVRFAPRTRAAPPSLPFGHFALVVGEPIRVEADADEGALMTHAACRHPGTANHFGFGNRSRFHFLVDQQCPPCGTLLTQSDIPLLLQSATSTRCSMIGETLTRQRFS